MCFTNTQNAHSLRPFCADLSLTLPKLLFPARYDESVSTTFFEASEADQAKVFRRQQMQFMNYLTHKLLPIEGNLLHEDRFTGLAALCAGGNRTRWKHLVELLSVDVGKALSLNSKLHLRRLMRAAQQQRLHRPFQASQATRRCLGTFGKPAVVDTIN